MNTDILLTILFIVVFYAAAVFLGEKYLFGKKQANVENEDDNDEPKDK